MVQRASRTHPLSRVTSDVSCVLTAISPTLCQTLMLPNWHAVGAKDLILQMRFGNMRGLQAENKKQVYRIRPNSEEITRAI